MDSFGFFKYVCLFKLFCRFFVHLDVCPGFPLPLLFQANPVSDPKWRKSRHANEACARTDSLPVPQNPPGPQKQMFIL